MKIEAMLGIQSPVIQAPMAGGTTTPELVSAVTNAGGLGSIGAGYMPPEALAKAIEQTRALTTGPFAVNLFIPESYRVDDEAINRANEQMAPYRRELNIELPAPPVDYARDFDAQLDVIIDARIPVFSFTFGRLTADQMGRLKQADIRVVGTATTIEEALVLEGDGVDAIVAQGADAGGHRGTFLAPVEQSMIGTFSLVPQMADAVSVPVIASGGIMDARGVRAALALGAQGVQMGSAFLVCEESGAKSAHKAALVSRRYPDTALTRAFSGKAARGLRNRYIDDMVSTQDNLPDYPVQNAWTKDIRAAAAAADQADLMSLWAGQAFRLARSESVAELMARLTDGWQ